MPNATTLAPLAAPPKIGVCRTAQWSLALPCSQAAVEACAEGFRRAGARVADLALPGHFAALIDAQKAIMAYEAAHNYVYETTRFAHLLSEPFRALCDRGRRISRDEYVSTQRAIALASLELASIIGDHDALIAPSAIGEAPLAETGTGDPVMSRMWTALHVPCLAVPMTKGPQGLPVGVQLIAANNADERLLQVGLWASQVLANMSPHLERAQ